MSKRSRRYRNPNLPQEAFNSPVASTPSAATSSATIAANGSGAATSSASIRRVNWQEEYNEVLGDLRKTAIIAVVLVTVMVVLSFVIR